MAHPGRAGGARHWVDTHKHTHTAAVVAAATGAVVAQRREAEGMTNREIRRCLVRYVARQLYRLLEQPARFDAT